MKAAANRRWQVGDRFFLNRWSEAYPEPLVFEVTDVTPTHVYFWAPTLDADSHQARRGRRRSVRREFYARVARRELVRR